MSTPAAAGATTPAHDMPPQRTTLQYYWLAWSTRRGSGILAVALMAAGTALLDVILPYAIAHNIQLLNDISHQQARGHFYDWLLIMLLISVSGFVARRAGSFLTAQRQPLVLRDLERYVFRQLTQHSETFFNNRFSGALVTQTKRFVNGYEAMEDISAYALTPMLVRMVVSLVVLVVVLPPVGLAMFVWLVLFAISVVWMTRKRQPLVEEEGRHDSILTGRIADVTTNILNMKTFAGRNHEITGYDDITETRRLVRKRSWFWGEIVYAYQALMALLLEILVMYLCIKMVAGDKSLLGVALLAQLYTGRLMSDLYQFSSLTRDITRALGDAQEMTDILNLPADIIDPPHARVLQVPAADVRFDAITFAYPNRPPVFESFTLQLQPGERVGLVGHSGSGKSTLIKLLLRFVEPQNGQILIDGQDTAAVQQDSLRRNIAYVSQEPVLFHRSIGENIKYSNPGATDEQVRQAARLSHANEFIDRLPDGYDTLVGERGVKLSGGEKQRVAIARAMLSEAPILVLDEATSSLDSISEGLVVDALEHLMESRTTLVIAHRLSTVSRLDRIIVLEDGAIKEWGSHEELLAQDGVYADMWTHQVGGMLKD